MVNPECSADESPYSVHISRLLVNIDILSSPMTIVHSHQCPHHTIVDFLYNSNHFHLSMSPDRLNSFICPSQRIDHFIFRVNNLTRKKIMLSLEGKRKLLTETLKFIMLFGTHHSLSSHSPSSQTKHKTK